MDTIKVTKTLDAKGLDCPMPLLKAKKAIATLESGQVVYGIDGLISDGASTTDHPLGVEYQQLEQIEVRAGDGADQFTIDASPRGTAIELLLADGNDVVTVVDHLGLDDTILIGHSMGGMLAALLVGTFFIPGFYAIVQGIRERVKAKMGLSNLVGGEIRTGELKGDSGSD